MLRPVLLLALFAAISVGLSLWAAALRRRHGAGRLLRSIPFVLVTCWLALALLVGWVFWSERSATGATCPVRAVTGVLTYLPLSFLGVFLYLGGTTVLASLRPTFRAR